MSELSVQVNSLDTIAIEINHIKNQTKQMILSASIEIGRRLVDAKEICTHGKWSAWLSEEVDYSQRTAQNLMRIFEEYGNSQINIFGNAKTQALAHLGYTQAVALLGLPEEEREEFIEENDIQEMSTRELQDAIKAKRDAEDQLQDKSRELEENQYEVERLNNLIESLKETSNNTELIEEVENLKNKLEEKEKDYQDSQEEVSRLVEEINTAQEISASIEDIEKLKAQLKKEKEKSKKLKEELDKPVEPTIVEVVPDEIKAELESLKAKLINEDSPLLAKFRLQFEGIQGEFERLTFTMNEISKLDSDTGLKVKNAIIAMLSHSLQQLE